MLTLYIYESKNQKVNKLFAQKSKNLVHLRDEKLGSNLVNDAFESTFSDALKRLQFNKQRRDASSTSENPYRWKTTKKNVETNLHYQHLYSDIQKEQFCFGIVMIYTHIKRREPDIVAVGNMCMRVLVLFGCSCKHTQAHNLKVLVFSVFVCVHGWEHEWNRKIFHCCVLPISLLR